MRLREWGRKRKKEALEKKRMKAQKREKEEAEYERGGGGKQRCSDILAIVWMTQVFGTFMNLSRKCTVAKTASKLDWWFVQLIFSDSGSCARMRLG